MSQLACPVPANENAERIVREAWELFQLRGYRGASVAELCERCGITKPTLYYYFHDKETLFIHVILRQLAGYRGILRAEGTSADGGLAERLTRLARAMLTTFSTDMAVMLRDMTHIKDPAHRETVRQAFQAEVFGPLVAALEADLGIGDRARAEFYAWAYLGLVNTFVGKSDRLATPPERLAEQLVMLFFDGISRSNDL
jgi:AcrR family transcriptional regulator